MSPIISDYSLHPLCCKRCQDLPPEPPHLGDGDQPDVRDVRPGEVQHQGAGEAGDPTEAEGPQDPPQTGWCVPNNGELL